MRSYDAIRKTYEDAFFGRTDYIPMMVGVRCTGRPDRAAMRAEPAASVARMAEVLAPKAAVESDWVPSVHFGEYQCLTIPSLYGATLVELAGSEPICEPCFTEIREAADAPKPEVAGPIVDEIVAWIRAARPALPDGWRLSLPVSASPFDLAQLLVGEGFLTGLITDPEPTRRFLETLAELFVEVSLLVKEELDEPIGHFVSNRGMFFPGHRAPSDAIVNFSPEMIRQFALPVYETISASLGPICVHVCTAPAPAGHVLPVLTESDAILAIDNWQGMDVFIGPDAPMPMQQKVGIVGDVKLQTPEQMDAFLARPPIRDTPRRNGRAIVVSTGGFTEVDDARRAFAEWQSRF